MPTAQKLQEKYKKAEREFFEETLPALFAEFLEGIENDEQCIRNREAGVEVPDTFRVSKKAAKALVADAQAEGLLDADIRICYFYSPSPAFINRHVSLIKLFW